MKLEKLWARLGDGSARVVGHGNSALSFHLMVDVDARPNGNSPERRQWDILHALLLGTSPMVIALERCLSRSTAMLASSCALQTSGATSGLRAVPLVLVAAAHAAAGLVSLGQVVGTNFVVESATCDQVRVATFRVGSSRPA